MGTSRTTQRVAANVRAELAVRQIKPAQLAAALRISTSTMDRRLKAQTEWPVDDLELVADFLGLTVASLLSERAVA